MRVSVSAGARERPGRQGSAVAGLLQRCGDHPCPPQGCSPAARHADAEAEDGASPGSVTRALRGPAGSLDPAVRRTMERRFHADFSQVQVHSGSDAAASARDVAARAYTVGEHVVFGPGEYDPGRPEGLRLLAHELTHVVQQRHAAAGLQRHTLAPADSDAAEHHADLVADRIVAGRDAGAAWNGPLRAGAPQRQPVATAARPAGHRVVPLAAPFPKVCARPALGFQHGFIDAPPFRYSLLKRCQPAMGAGPGIPLISGGNLGLPLHPTAAYASAHGGDPCGERPTCVECAPKPGVASLDACFAAAHARYPNPSEYVVSGPNSNTYASTLARACCQSMDSAPSPFGWWLPGWNMSPPRPIATVGHCGEPANCEDEPLVRSPASHVDRMLRGGIGLGLLGGLIGLAAGGPLGALIGGGIGLAVGLAVGLFK